MTKRPMTIYGCSPDQKSECDYKYLARVWFYRSIAIFLGTAITASAGVFVFVGEWKKGTEIKLEIHDQKFIDSDVRIKRVESLLEKDIDSLKTWLRPKGDK